MATTRGEDLAARLCTDIITSDMQGLVRGEPGFTTALLQYASIQHYVLFTVSPVFPKNFDDHGGVQD